MRSMFELRIWLPALGLILPLGSSCKKSEEAPEVSDQASAPAEPRAQSAEPSDTPPAGEAPAEAEPSAAQTTTLAEAGFRTPESVLHDAEQDVYFVSNVDGSPLEEDRNGFISRVNAETQQVETKWIESGKNGVILNAPKGLAIAGDILYVTDITTIRKFDRKSGEPKGEILLEGATFANALTVGPDGALYASDTGLKAGEDGFAPSGTDAVFKVSPSDDRVEKIAEGEPLGGPNGLVFNDKGLWVATFRSGEIYRLDEGKKTDVQKPEKGSLDGLVALADGNFLISSWEGKLIYQGPPSGPFKPAVENIESPANIGFDAKRNLVLIPLFQLNKVQLTPLPAPGA